MILTSTAMLSAVESLKRSSNRKVQYFNLSRALNFFAGNTVFSFIKWSFECVSDHLTSTTPPLLPPCQFPHCFLAYIYAIFCSSFLLLLDFIKIVWLYEDKEYVCFMHTCIHGSNPMPHTQQVLNKYLLNGINYLRTYFSNNLQKSSWIRCSRGNRRLFC